jgi:hypothetical protein
MVVFRCLLQGIFGKNMQDIIRLIEGPSLKVMKI